MITNDSFHLKGKIAEKIPFSVGLYALEGVWGGLVFRLFFRFSTIKLFFDI